MGVLAEAGAPAVQAVTDMPDCLSTPPGRTCLEPEEVTAGPEVPAGVAATLVS
jgi:hypothetical protein